MWSAPFNFDFYSNWLAVGIADNVDSDNGKWADTMYYHDGPFSKGEYKNSMNWISYSDDEVTIKGSMGTAHKTQVNIEIHPKQMVKHKL